MSARTRRAADYLEHAPDCPGAKLAARRDDDGAVVLACRTCGAAEYVDRLVPAVEPAPPIDPGYRCRTHQTEPVDWRGRGCPWCEQSTRDRQAARAARREARITSTKE